MIHWLLEDISNHPDIAQGECPDGLLNGAEHRHLDTLRVPKRRYEWLLGRWTAKHLLHRVNLLHGGPPIPFDRMTIVNMPSGAPVVSGLWFENVTLSISHRGGFAFCAARLRPLGCSSERCALGADIELIEPRTPSFAESYFTAPERAALARTGDDAQHLMTTAIWSAKESALKAAHLGLNVDTRALTCHITPVGRPPEHWTPFRVTWHERWLPDSPRLDVHGWWRATDNYVLTVAAQGPVDGMPASVPLAAERVPA